MFKVLVPGSTSNLGSGFDAFGLALQIYLRVEVSVEGDDLQILCTGDGADELPSNADHLVYSMIDACFHKAGKTVPGLRIKAHNEIPLSRGLGSSGAAIIAGLIIGQKLSGLRMTDAQLLAMANDFEGHPENIASSYFGGLTINCHSGGGVLCKRVTADPKLKVVVVIPDIRISTNAARSVLPKKVEHSDAVFNLQRSALLAHAFLTQDYTALRTAMQDKLHQAYRSQLIPGFADFESVAYEKGALAMAVSGSGSTLVGFTDSDPEPLRKAWQAQGDALQLDARTMILEVNNTGVFCEER